MITNLREYLNLRNIVANLIILVIYVAAGKFGLSLAVINPQASAIWFPTGIAIAAFILFGEKVFPAIYIGAFIVNVTTAGSVASSFLIAFGNTLEGLVAASLISKYANGKKVLESVQDISKFALFAAVCGPAISATIGTATLHFSGLAPNSQIIEIWKTWFLGDATGAIIVAPIILIWYQGILHNTYPFKRVVEGMISFYILGLLGWLIFSGVFPYAYLCIPILIWIIFRFGRRGGSIAIVLLSVMAIYNTILGVGPFILEGSSVNETFILLQIFIAVISITMLIFASLFYEERKVKGMLESREHRFQSLIENSSDVIILLNIVGNIIYAGPSTERVFGYKAEEVLGMNAFNFLHPDDRERVLKILMDLVKKPGETIPTEYRIIRKDKQVRWVESLGTNLLLDSNVNAVVVNLRDVTDRRIIEESLNQEKAEDEALIASIGDAIIATDKDERVTLVNPAFEQMLGFAYDQINGHEVKEFLKLEDEEGRLIQENMRPLRRAIASRLKITTTHYLVRSDGSKFPAIIVATPVIFDGQIVGGIKVIHDITAEKEIDRAKSEFVSTASHQLKTPLGTERWYLESVMGEEGFKLLPQKEQDYIKQVYESNLRVISLVKGLLDIAKMEQGKTTENPEIINITELIIELIKEESKDAEVRHIEIKLEGSHDIIIKIDRKKFTAIIQNLISNAIKYSQDYGKVNIKLETKDDIIKLEVQDNGIGISESDKNKLFAKFYRGQNAVSKYTDGSGLGLYLVKSYLEAWKGKIWYESTEGKGTTFHIEIPTDINN